MLPFPKLSLLLLSSLLAFAAGGPSRHTGQPAPWVGEIRVYNPTGWQRNVRAAADAWNRTGVTPKFVFVHDARHAQVTVTASTEAVAARCTETYTCDAFARRHGRRGAIWLPTQVGEEVLSPSLVRLIVHELGHVLGLRHEMHHCARMNTDTGARLCGVLRVPPGTYRMRSAATRHPGRGAAVRHSDRPVLSTLVLRTSNRPPDAAPARDRLGTSRARGVSATRLAPRRAVTAPESVGGVASQRG